MNAVETLVITSQEGARRQFVIDKIRHAGALFIAGVIAKGAPMGGTSAGLAMRGQYMFSALNDTIQSIDALQNPFDRRVTIGHDFSEGATPRRQDYGRPFPGTEPHGAAHCVSRTHIDQRLDQSALRYRNRRKNCPVDVFPGNRNRDRLRRCLLLTRARAATAVPSKCSGYLFRYPGASCARTTRTI
jgi:hypothetical protein